MLSLKNSMIMVFIIIFAMNWGQASAQLDERFGAGGVEGTKYLGQKGLLWFRDWEDSYLRTNFPPEGKNKLWTVGKIDYRTDDLGMDWKWYVLDLLESTDVDLMQDFFDLCLAVVDKNIVPMIGDYWVENKDSIETELELMLNNFVYVDKKLGIKYRAKCKKTQIAFQDTLPDFSITVNEDMIHINTSLAVDWTTHIYIQAWILNPNPFHWGYYWKNIGDANCKFRTILNVAGDISLNGLGRERHLQITSIKTNSKTQSDIDWKLLGIPFTWDDLSNEVENQVDKELEKTMNNELNKDEYKKPYYFIDYFKSLFPKEIVPTQQEILDRIITKESEDILSLIIDEGRKGEYWSIGSEPNWYLKMRPTQYAAYYTKYYHLIKGLDPSAKILGPSIFITEAVENPADMVYLMIPGVFLGLIEPIKEQFTNFVASYFQTASTQDWYRSFISHLPEDVKIDVNDFHIYPLNSENTAIDWDNLYLLMDDIARFTQNTSGAEETWVTEFGNRDWRRSETEAAEMCRQFCQYFKSNEIGITRWFWYRSYGYSPFFDIPMTPQPPKSALLDKKMNLTPIGKVYLDEADNTPPIMAEAVQDGGENTNLREVLFVWKEAIEYDTGVIDYQLHVGTAPGDSNVYNEWVGKIFQAEVTGQYGQTLYAQVRAKNGAGLIGQWSESSDGIKLGRWDDTAFDGTDLLSDNQDGGSNTKPSLDDLLLKQLLQFSKNSFSNRRLMQIFREHGYHSVNLNEIEKIAGMLRSGAVGEQLQEALVELKRSNDPGKENEVSGEFTQKALNRTNNPLQPILNDAYITTVLEDFMVNEHSGNDGFYKPSIATAENGNFFVVWVDYRNTESDIYGRLFNSFGEPLGNSFRINDDVGHSQDLPVVVCAPGGNFVVVWVDYRNGNEDIYFQQYNDNGEPLAVNTKVNDDIGIREQDFPSAAMDNEGNFIVVWDDARGDNYAVYCQRFLRDGSAVGTNFRVKNESSVVSQTYPVVAIDGQGDFAVAWENYQSGANNIYCRQFKADGSPRNDAFKVNDDPTGLYNINPQIVADSEGNFNVVWEDYRNSSADIYCQLYHNDGSLRGVNFRINDDNNDQWQYQPAIDMDKNGNFAIAWQDYRNGNPDIYCQLFDDHAERIGPNYQVNNETAEYVQSKPDVALRQNFIYYCWTDGRISEYNYDIFGRIDRYDLSPAVPIVLEAEEMSNRNPWSGSSCDGGWRLTHAEQPIFNDVNFPQDTLYHFSIRAKAEIAGDGWPWLKIEIGDIFKGYCEVNSSTWQEYTYAAKISPGIHRLSLTYLNDFWNKDEGDRNLLLDKVEITYQEDAISGNDFTFEAEKMVHQHPLNYQSGDYIVLHRPYAYSSQEMYFDQSEMTFNVYVKGDSSLGHWPQVNLCIDENSYHTISISDTCCAQYQVFVSNITPGKHRVKLAYNPDSYAYGRNIYFDKLVIHSQNGGLLKPMTPDESAETTNVAQPLTFALEQNYPNPFNPLTYIKYQLPQDSYVKIHVYNALGQQIRVLVDEFKAAGYYTIQWNGKDNGGNDVVSGMYFYQLKTGDQVFTRKMALLK